MSHWTTTTSALSSVTTSLKTVDALLSLVKDGQGKPSAKERAIFAAAVVFLYGIWENYVEQLAIELVGWTSKSAVPDKVPEQVRRSLEKKSAWELTIHPGWRELWAESVKLAAVGDDDERFGMNTAKAGQVKNLLLTAGAKDPLVEISPSVIPSHLANTIKLASDAINKLVELRGEIVHTGQVPSSLRKAHVLAWKTFVKDVCEQVDKTCRAQCKAIAP